MAPFESTDHGFLPQDLATTSDVTFGSLQIAEKVLFQYSGSSPHALAEIDAKKDGTNGGDLEFYTKIDTGSMTKKLTIASTGAIGIGADPDYGTLNAGHVLTSRGSDSAPTWTTPASITPIYAYSYLSDTYIDQVTSSTSTFYRVGHTTPFTSGAVSASGIVGNTSGQHKLTIPSNNTGVYRVDATIVMEINGSQGAVEWEGRIMRNSGGTISEIAYAQRHYTDYPAD